MRGQLKTIEAARAYVFGGEGRITLLSKRTGDRFTYKLSRPPAEEGKRRPIFVRVLSGPDNGSDYTFLGSIWPSPEGARYAHSQRSRVGSDAPSVVAFEWFVGVLARQDAARFEQLELFHEGTCGRCGRPLTVPESIESGLGPVCATR